MPPSRTFGWLEIDRIAEALARAHPAADPYAIRFPDLRRMIESLSDFKEEPGHPVNERILETIQAHWQEERDGRDDEED